MSRSSSLVLFGILTMLAPFSGLPIALRSLLEVIFGACVLGIGIALRSETIQAARAAHESPAAESAPTISPIS